MCTKFYKLFAIAILFLIHGCATVENHNDKVDWSQRVELKKPKSSTEKDCSIAGGTWYQFNFDLQYYCSIATNDAGMKCEDNSGCMSFCETTMGVDEGEDTPGKCYPYYDWTGCIQSVQSGKASSAICAH